MSSFGFSEEITQVVIKKVNEYYQKKFHHVENDIYSQQELEQIGENLSSWALINSLLQFVFLIVLIPLFGWAFYEVYVFTFKHLLFPNSAVFLFRWSTFCIPCFFLAIGVVYYPVEVIQYMLMGKKYDALNEVYNRMKGYDNRKAGIHFSKTFAIIFFVFLLPFFSSGIVVNGDKFIVKTVFDLYPKSYYIRNLSFIEYYSAYINDTEKIDHKEFFLMKFADSTSLGSSNWEFSNDEVVFPFIKLLSDKGVAVDTFELSEVDNQ